MKAPALALLAITLFTSSARADYHAICPFAQSLCGEYDELKNASSQPTIDPAAASQLRERLIKLSRGTEELAIEQADSWPLKDDPAALRTVFADLTALRESVEKTPGSRASPELLAHEETVDLLFGRLPGNTGDRQAFGERVAAEQAGLSAFVRSGGGAYDPRVAALRDGLAMLAVAAGASAGNDLSSRQSLLRSEKAGSESPAAAPVAVNSAPGQPTRIADLHPSAAFAARIAALPYGEKIKFYLRIVAANADAVDAESTIGTLERAKPAIEVLEYRPDDDEAGGYDSEKNRIEIKPGYLVGKVKTGGQSATPVWSGTVLGLKKELFADGHARFTYADTEMAGHLVHEVQHTRRHYDGGGANGFTNEMDAFDIQNRFYTRLIERYGRGGSDFSEQATDDWDTWRIAPWTFRRKLIKDYIKHKEIRPGEVTIEEQTRGVQKRLEKYEKDPTAVILVGYLKRQLEQLPRDRELSEEAWKYHQTWRLKQKYDRVPLER